MIKVEINEIEQSNGDLLAFCNNYKSYFSNRKIYKANC